MQKMSSTIIKYLLTTLFAIGLGFFAYALKSSKLEYYEFKGSIKYNNLEIGTYTSGKVKEIFADEGQVIEPGNKIFEIENEIITEKLQKMDPQSPNFSEPDYAELKKRVDNFEIKAPYKSVIAKIYKYKGSFVKDNETLATLIPLETIRYSFDIYDDQLNEKSKEELLQILKPDKEVTMLFSKTYQIKAKIKSVVPDLQDPHKKIVYLSVEKPEELTFNISQTFAVQIPKEK